MSAFDPEEFMNTTVEGANDTKRPVFSGGQYPCQIFKVTPKSGTIGKGDNAGKTWASLLLTLEVLDEGAKEETQQDRVFCSYNVFLDLTNDEQLDMGKNKNIQLGKLRKAVGQNNDDAWSPAMLQGQMIMADIIVGVDQRGDEQNNVRGVAAYEG